MRSYGFREISFRKIGKGMHNPAATGDKGRVPVSSEVSQAGSASLDGSDDTGGWILRWTKSFGEAAPV